MRHLTEQASRHKNLVAQIGRCEAVAFAKGSMRLEGEVISAWAEERLAEFVSGERSINSVIREWKQIMSA